MDVDMTSTDRVWVGFAHSYPYYHLHVMTGEKRDVDLWHIIVIIIQSDLSMSRSSIGRFHHVFRVSQICFHRGDLLPNSV